MVRTGDWHLLAGRLCVVADCESDGVPILHRELELLKEQGASVVQIDDPHL